jgi:hypothetical protein
VDGEGSPTPWDPEDKSADLLLVDVDLLLVDADLLLVDADLLLIDEEGSPTSWGPEDKSADLLLVDGELFRWVGRPARGVRGRTPPFPMCDASPTGGT